MTRRCAVIMLARPGWAPPGVDREAWRHALAEDIVDLLATLADVDLILAVGGKDDRAVAEAVRWPGMRTVEATRPLAAMSAAGTAGYAESAVLVPDVPDLPAMLVGKLFQPLARPAVAAAPVRSAAAGLIGLAAPLPAPAWLRAADPDLGSASIDGLRAAADAPRAVVACPGWHRLDGPAGLAYLDPAVEGWEATRALLS